MTISEKVQAVLASTTAVTTLVPATKISVPEFGQNIARPYIRHFPVAPDPTQTHGGLDTHCGWLYQLSCFADSFSKAEAIAVAVRNALRGVHTTAGQTLEGFWRGQSEDLYEPDTSVHHIAVELTIFETLA